MQILWIIVAAQGADFMLKRDVIHRIAYIAGVAAAVYLIFRYLLPLVIPFVLAYIAAGWLMPVLRKLLGVIRLPYKLGVAVLLIVVVGIIGSLFTWLAVVLAGQIKLLFVNAPVLQSNINDRLKAVCSSCDGWFGIESGSLYGYIALGADYLGDNYLDKIMPVVTERAWSVCIWLCSLVIMFMFFLLGTWLIMEDYDNIRNYWKERPVIKELLPVITDVRQTMGAYLRTQGIIICIVSAICTLALFITGNPYALLIGILIAVFDALPIVGSGSILIPWTIIYLIQGDYVYSGIMITAYVLSLIARETLESRLMGHRTGLSPIYLLISFYVGIQLFGVAGVILGPVGMVTVIALCRRAET